MNKNGRIEKSVEAHKGATTVGKWSSDGSALLTGIITFHYILDCCLRNSTMSLFYLKTFEDVF